MDISDFPTRHNYLLALSQRDFERILAGWIEELEVPMIRAPDVVGFTQDDAGIDVALSDESTLRAQYLVGCDGGRSLVRKTAGIDFPGFDPSTSFVIAEVEMTEDSAPPPSPRRAWPTAISSTCSSATTSPLSSTPRRRSSRAPPGP